MFRPKRDHFIQITDTDTDDDVQILTTPQQGRQRTLDGFVVPQAVMRMANSAANSTRTRQTYTNEQVREATDAARSGGHPSYGVTRLRALFQLDVPLRTVRNWHDHWKATRTYFTIAKRGRQGHLNDEQEQEVLDAFDALRSRGEQVTASLTASVGMGIQLKDRGVLVAEHGGPQVFSRSWANTFMKRHQIGVYRKTTDRVIPASVVLEGGERFFDLLRTVAEREERIALRDTYNADEFCCLLHRDGKSWSWHRHSQKRVVPLRETKLACTANVLSAADGSVPLLQLIWEGTTERCHAHPPHSHVDPNITQHHNPDSHFQSAATFKAWLEGDFLPVAQARRGVDKTTIILIIDAAPQHHYAGMQEFCAKHNILVVSTPPAQTHYYQPADQYVIANLKKLVCRGWCAYVANVFAKYTGDEALTRLLTANAGTARMRKYLLLSAALKELGRASVVHSWEVTGILQALFRAPPPTKTNYGELRDAGGATIEFEFVDDEDEGDAPAAPTEALAQASEVPDQPIIPASPLDATMSATTPAATTMPSANGPDFFPVVGGSTTPVSLNQRRNEPCWTIATYTTPKGNKKRIGEHKKRFGHAFLFSRVMRPKFAFRRSVASLD